MSIPQPAFGENRLYINGELCEPKSGKYYYNINPATGEVIGNVADSNIDDAKLALTSARTAFDSTDWGTNHVARLAHLRKFETAIKANLDHLKEAAIAEAGSTRHNAQGPQAEGPVNMIEWTLDYLEHFQWDRDIGNYTSVELGMTSKRIVCKEAAGVVAAITPWNFPIQIILAKVIPALAAGCTVILKPAPDTPWTASLFGRIAHESGLPAGVFNVLTANDPTEIGVFLCEDKRVDVVSFTGSTPVGKEIMRRGSDTVKRVFLELGGKSANVVLDDADLGSALLNCLAVCYHAGQGCVIATRLLVPEDKVDESVKLLQSYFGMITYGDQEAPGTIMGPLINAKQQDKVLGLIEQGKSEGAELVLGGSKPANLEKGFWVEPTIFVDRTGETCVSTQEIFGPVLTIIPYKDQADAIRIANDSDYGLGAGVISASEERAIKVARQLRTGIVNVNGGNFLAPDAPFGGYKQSGVGREMGPEGFEEYLETKTIAIGV
jgi:aldehyde dehydrogenase (NAD+)